MLDVQPAAAKKQYSPRKGRAASGPSGKELANRVSNTSEEMAEYAWRYALAEINRKAHGRK